MKLKASHQFFSVILLLMILAALVLVNAQNLDWGLPGSWNPDELVYRALLALDGKWEFDTLNFDYPSLPKYVMLYTGQLTDALGIPRLEFIVIARLISVLLGAMSALLAFILIRQMRGTHWTALLAALLVATNSELAVNSHYAHNDLYVTFFVALCLVFTMQYLNSEKRVWLYFSFFTAGLAASSKYNGGAIILAALLAHGLVAKEQLLRERFHAIETLFMGAVLSIAGYVLGTPRALTSFRFYIMNLLPALARHAVWNRTPDSLRGWLGQWELMVSAFGFAVFLLFLISLAAFIVISIRVLARRQKVDPVIRNRLLVIFGSIFVLDLPIMISYNVQNRFFLPLLVPMAVFCAYLVERLLKWLEQKEKKLCIILVVVAVVVILLSSAARIASVTLSFKHDARIAAGKFLETLPPDAHYEATWYAPNFPDVLRNTAEYPLVFLKFPDQTVPTDTLTPWNVGEKGVELRKPDYLVVSSFIYERFEDPYICERHQADCDFFQKLLKGETNYAEIAYFNYEVPTFLPRLELKFVNPQIRIFERKAN